MSMNEIKEELNKWKRYSIFMDRKFSIVKILSSFQLGSIFNAIPTNQQVIHKYPQTLLKFKRVRKTQNIQIQY